MFRNEEKNSVYISKLVLFTCLFAMFLERALLKTRFVNIIGMIVIYIPVLILIGNLNINKYIRSLIFALFFFFWGVIVLGCTNNIIQYFYLKYVIGLPL